MRILSFSVFKDKIKDGTKSTTIRRPWKRPLRLGETLQAVWKTRSKNREVLGTVKIKAIKPFKFRELSCVEYAQTAHTDGFDIGLDMYEFFEGHYGTEHWTMDFELITFEFTPLHLEQEHDIYVKMPPVKEYKIKVKIKSVEKGKLRFVEAI